MSLNPAISDAYRSIAIEPTNNPEHIVLTTIGMSPVFVKSFREIADELDHIKSRLSLIDNSQLQINDLKSDIELLKLEVAALKG